MKAEEKEFKLTETFHALQPKAERSGRRALFRFSPNAHVGLRLREKVKFGSGSTRARELRGIISHAAPDAMSELPREADAVRRVRHKRT